MKRLSLSFLALMTLGAAAASAQPWYILMPTVTPGVTASKVEMFRSNTALVNVAATYVPNGKSLNDENPVGLKAFIGPGGAKANPLLDISAFDGGGMVELNPVTGLSAVESDIEIDANPIKTAWKLPVLTQDEFFPAKSTVYVQNLVKATDASSNLQIFGLGTLAANCTASVLRPKGTIIESREIVAPAMGPVLVTDILRKVGAATATGINVAVTCDQPFYPLAAYPATNRTQIRVEYPVAKLPTGLTAETLEDRPGVFLNATSEGNANILIPLDFDPAKTHHVTTIDFDGAVAAPDGFIVFWNIAGLFRKGGRRFDKTLFFGNFYNYGKQKYVADVGTPYIETTVKYVFPLKPGNRYHWSITLDNDQQSNHYVITNGAGGVILDTLVGLYNPVESDSGGDAPTLQVGLNGIADGAYFPPVGWRFSNLKVVTTTSP